MGDRILVKTIFVQIDLPPILKNKFGFIVLLMWMSSLALVHVSLEDSTSTLGSCVHGLLEDTLGKWNLET